MSRDVPFVSNTDDDLHCLQAAYMSIAKYFEPDFSIDMEEWSELTGFEKGKGTWASAALLWFADNGYAVRHISLFDYEKFISSPAEYLIELTGKEVGQWQIAHSNLPLETERAKQLLARKQVEKREPTQQEIKRLLDDGYLARVLVNSFRLNGKEGYFGHAVTIFDYDDDGFILHDPGLPPIPNRKVGFKEFEEAWADPNPESKELDAVKKLL